MGRRIVTYTPPGSFAGGNSQSRGKGGVGGGGGGGGWGVDLGSCDLVEESP